MMINDMVLSRKVTICHEMSQNVIMYHVKLEDLVIKCHEKSQIGCALEMVIPWQ